MSELSQADFKKISKKLHTFITENPTPTAAQMQQYLAQSMYNKTFEEAQKTILSGKKLVTVFRCNNQIYIFNKERFIRIIKNCDEKELLKILLKDSRIKADSVKILDIPLFDDEEFFESKDDFKYFDKRIVPELSYIKKMARKMGGFTDFNIWDDIENSKYFFISFFGKNNECYIEDHYSDESLCGNWFNEVESEGRDSLCLIIEDHKVDTTFSFDDLTNAKFDGKQWTIQLENEGAIIRFEK